jgi:hypothetical protein
MNHARHAAGRRDLPGGHDAPDLAWVTPASSWPHAVTPRRPDLPPRLSRLATTASKASPDPGRHRNGISHSGLATGGKKSREATTERSAAPAFRFLK